MALAEVKDDLSKYLRLAVDEEIVITRHGRPAGVLIGFASEDDWFDYRLEHHPEFIRRIDEARAALREGRVHCFGTSGSGGHAMEPSARGPGAGAPRLIADVDMEWMATFGFSPAGAHLLSAARARSA